MLETGAHHTALPGWSSSRAGQDMVVPTNHWFTATGLSLPSVHHHSICLHHHTNGQAGSISSNVVHR